MTIQLLDRPATTTDPDEERLARGIAAILRAIEDVKAGRLKCSCPEHRDR
jgi:hypothetical protein